MKHNLASNDSKKSMNNSHGFSLMLVSTINVLERVHIREFPVYDPFMTVIFHFYELQFISQSIQTQTLYISGGYMHSFFCKANPNDPSDGEPSLWSLVLEVCP